MKEPYREGLANHPGPKPCVGPSRDGREALEGADASRKLSHEMGHIETAIHVDQQGKETFPDGNTHCGDRQASRSRVSGVEEPVRASETVHAQTGRPRKVTVTRHECGGSAGKGQPTIAQKAHLRGVGHQHSTEEGGEQARQQRAAESLEGRTVAKGNLKGETGSGTQRPSSPVNKLRRVREAAREDRNLRFNNLMHHITAPLLLNSFEQLNHKAVPGVDDVTWKAYDKEAYWNTRKLHQRVHSGSYRAKPSRRLYIPKEDGRQRPIGVAAMEDKIVQQAVATILNEIYEEDFLGYNYGFRPGLSQHKALDQLYVELTERRVEWVLDGDISGFFDHIDHEWMMNLLQHRIADQRILRLIAKWLRAGVSEEGKWSETTVGTPQGAVISPLLGNIYLHYVMDLWVDQWRKRHASGEVYIVRFADDFVMGFEKKEDAEKLHNELRGRLAKFGLELHPEKTRLIEFGRHAARNRAKENLGKPETFNFLGFTHICSRTRKSGVFTVLRKTIAKRLKNKIKDVRQKLKRGRHRPVKLQGAWLHQVITGYYNYHGVPRNQEALSRLRWEIAGAWYAALRRRSQKARRLTWEQMKKPIDTWLPKPRITHPWPNQRFHQQQRVTT